MSDNSPVKARMFVGGLKSLFLDMAETLEQIEKTGAMPVDMLESLVDVKAAIDMTLVELNKNKIRCCEHEGNCYHESQEEECESCEQPLVDCECEFCEECGEEMHDCECEEQEEPLPPQKSVIPIKKQETKVVISKKKPRN